MTYKFNKKNKSKLYFFLSFLFFLTIFNYIYQVNFVKEIYSINLTLKNNLTFENNSNNLSLEISPNNLFDENLDYESNKILTQLKKSEYIKAAMERYERTLQLGLEAKISYEKNYDKNLIQLSQICEKLGLQVQGNYLFASCLTSNPKKAKIQIINNLTKTMLATEENINSKVVNNILIKLGISSRSKNDDIFLVVNEKIVSTKNQIKNVIKLDLIFAFLFIIIGIIKINKIIS